MELHQDGGWGRSACVQELFEEQVRRTPEMIAIKWKEEGVSYEELNRRANRLAHHLRGLGVGSDVRVGLCLERSVELIVALLGVLKAGGAYVPLDPSYPVGRLSYMLEDAKAAVLVTSEKGLERLPSSSVQVVCFERDWDEIQLERADNPMVETEAENLAYVIYTSGIEWATERGWLFAHSNLNNYLTWARRFYVRPGLRGALLHSPLSFDLSVTSLWCPLLCGLAVELAEVGREIEACQEGGQTGGDVNKTDAQSICRAWNVKKWRLVPGTVFVVGGRGAAI